MIDTLSIVISLGAVLYVLVRSVGLDRLLPWFERLPPRPRKSRP